MRITPTEIREVLLVEPDVFSDGRGAFYESYSERRYAEGGLAARFVQDNVSRSARGILRALHLQSPPHAQGKLVSVLRGEVFDVALDARVGSPTFGRHVSRRLSCSNQHQLYVPPGFAHGLCVLSEEAIVTFKCTAFYAPEAELTISYCDPALGIEWPIANPQVLPRDASGLALAEVPAERLVRYG